MSTKGISNGRKKSNVMDYNSQQTIYLDHFSKIMQAMLEGGGGSVKCVTP